MEPSNEVDCDRAAGGGAGTGGEEPPSVLRERHRPSRGDPGGVWLQTEPTEPLGELRSSKSRRFPTSPPLCSEPPGDELQRSSNPQTLMARPNRTSCTHWRRTASLQSEPSSCSDTRSA